MLLTAEPASKLVSNLDSKINLMNEVKIRPPSQQSMFLCFKISLLSVSLFSTFLPELCNELNKIVAEYTQIFQSLSSFDYSKDIMKCASNLAAEDKLIDGTVVQSYQIHENLKNFGNTFDFSFVECFHILLSNSILLEA